VTLRFQCAVYKSIYLLTYLRTKLKMSLVLHLVVFLSFRYYRHQFEFLKIFFGTVWINKSAQQI